jgi:hypothetical protein
MQTTDPEPKVAAPAILRLPKDPLRLRPEKYQTNPIRRGSKIGETKPFAERQIRRNEPIRETGKLSGFCAPAKLPNEPDCKN